MSRIPINGNALEVQRGGEGEPVVLVHGSWSGHAVWQTVAADLRRRHHVVAYDRLGHAGSDRPDTSYARRRHEDDLVALIEHLDAGPVHLVGSSYGAAISLAVAARRHDLVRSVIGHEPPMNAPDTPAVRATLEAMNRVAARIADGDVAGGTKAFFEDIAVGPGGWELLPESFRSLAVSNAPTFAAELQDPGWLTLDPAALAAIPARVVLTEGDRSPAWFADALDALTAAMPQATRITVPGAGHGPHTTHPVEYAALLIDLISGAGAPSAGGSLRASA
jgi:pimeloyl-ACP methyl ester carboxylesterase